MMSSSYERQLVKMFFQGRKSACLYLTCVLLRAKKVGHQISVSFEKFHVIQALLFFFLTLFQLTV
jgi:hypothetical protein